MGQSNMPKITDAQVEVAHGAFLGVLNLNSNEIKAMRAALEAYERVRDVDRILDTNSEAMEGRGQMIRKEYPL